MNEKNEGYRIFHRDQIRRTWIQIINNKPMTCAIAQMNEKFYRLSYCIMEHDPYVVITERNIEEISKDEFEFLKIAKF